MRSPFHRLPGASIRAKLFVLVGVALLMLMLSAALGYWGMSRNRMALNEITKTRMASVVFLQMLNEAKTAVQVNLISVFMYEADTGAQTQFAQLLRRDGETWVRIDKARDEYQQLRLDDDERAQWEAAEVDLRVWRENAQRLAQILERLAKNDIPDEQPGMFSEYAVTYSVSAPLFLKAERSLNELLEESIERANTKFEQANKDADRAGYLIVSITGVAFCVLLILGVVISRAVTRPIRTAIEAASQIASGNLGMEIQVTSRDEMASMLKSIAAMQGQLRSVVGVIHRHADEIGNTCSRLSGTTKRISVASHQQVEATADMAALIQTSAESIDRIAGHAAGASQLAVQTGEISASGERVIKDVAREVSSVSCAAVATADQVRDLGARTKEISTVVTVIKEVAEQTNLLALNAAIEAARAGENGRGFAVVADEVRKLAERTANSTQQIADTVRQIVGATDKVVAAMQTQVEKMANVEQLAEHAGVAVESINRETTRLVATVREISTTLDSQRQSNTQVASTVDEISGMSRTNGEEIHECAESASRLADLAVELRNAVDTFRFA